jgi:peptidoglycan/LPS O-acetylase OafA/YrhL
MDKRQIVGLDLIRFGAAILVMVHHLGFEIWARGYVSVRYRYLEPIGWPGWVGVEIFFVLSGFIISYTAQASTPLAFAKNRSIRLFPAIWICATITALVRLMAHGKSSLLLQIWLHTLVLYPKPFYIDGTYWTLLYEIAFYTIIFVLLYFGILRRLDLTISLMGLASSFYWIYMAVYSTSTPNRPIGGVLLNLYNFLNNVFLRHFVSDYGCVFAVGALLWLILFDHPSTVRILVMFFCIVGGLLEIRNHASVLSGYFQTQDSWISPAILWLFSIAAMVFAVRSNSQIAKVIGARGVAAIRLLGLITYPLYLLHFTIGWEAIAFLHPYLPDLLSLFIVMTGIIALSFAVHLWLEKPLQKVARKLLFKPRVNVVLSPAISTLP